MNVRVFLVGAGPGDPGLITRRGLELLRRADVVIYDRLVAPQLVEEAPREAERIFVGKQPGDRLMPQAQIDRTIVEHARRGAIVVRLKGGDPFVFGRGADEAQALAAAGIPFEIVPGVTSAIAAPSYAGIPVTHSGLSSSFTVLTAHQSADRPETRARWSALATGAETLVLLMGVATLRDVCKRLVDAGRPASEPAAVVEWGTTSLQRTVVGTLETIADIVDREGIRPPATTIVGPVVGLRNAVAWFESRPLFGRTIVVTRPAAEEDRLTRTLTELGARVVHVPVIEIVDADSYEALDKALVELAAFDWIAFSSPNGVRKVFDRLAVVGRDARAFAPVEIAAVGKATADELARHGIVADVVPDHATGAAMTGAIGSGKGRILLPRPAGAPREVPDSLSALGWDVVEVAAYMTRPSSGEIANEDIVREGAYDLVTFASPSAVDAFVDRFGTPTGAVACIGSTTAAAAARRSIEVVVTPERHGAEALAEAVSGYLRK